MKKRKILLILTASIFVCSLLLFSACMATNRLAAPSFLGLDENNVISWTEVDLARGYRISIENENGETTVTATENTYYSLDSLSEGNYYIRLQSVGNNRDIKDSAWSSAKDFRKGYSTGLVYELIQNETAYAIVNVGRASGEVVIEDEYRDNKPVIQISDRAFKNNKKITKVTLGANITYVGKEAFYGCTALQEIVIPEGVAYMGESTFQNCSSLRSIKIPSTLSSVPKYAFAYCRNIENIEFCVEKVVPEDENTWVGTTTIGESAFTDCRTVEELILPETLTGIESGAFRQMAELAKVTIGNNVTYINSDAFSSDAKLSEVVFGEDSGLTFIGQGAFSGCMSLESISLPEALEEISSMAFYNCSSLDNIKIPDSVAEIGQMAFYNTKEYTEQTKVVTDSEQTKTNFKFIDRWLVEFVGNKSTLTNFNTSYPKYQPERDGETGIVGIASGCFSGCESLSTVRIHKSIKYLSSKAFYECSSLTKLTFESGSELKKIGSTCFYKAALETVDLPTELESIKSYAFYACEKLEEVKLPSTLTSIGRAAFTNTKIWTRAGQQDGVLRIGNWAVGFNPGSEDNPVTNLDVDLNEGDGEWGHYGAIEHIADYAFSGTLITGVKGTTNLISIGSGAFYKCAALRGNANKGTTFELNRRFEEIKPYTFYGCTSLSQVSIQNYQNGSSLEKIGNFAFFKCGLSTAFGGTSGVIDLSVTKIKEVPVFAFGFTYANEIKMATNSGRSTIESIASYAFHNMQQLTTVSIPSSVKTVGAFSFFECDKLSSLTINEGVEYIYQRAFYGCDSLKTVTFPASLVYIGAGAFYKCYDLQKIEFVTEELPEEDGGVKGVKIIDSYAFYDDEKLTVLELPASLTYIGKYAFFGLEGLGSAVLPSSIETMGQHIFYGFDLTIYAEPEKRPDGWSAKWNSLMRPVVWGSVLSEDKSYVVALKVTENTFEYADDFRSLDAPRRSGYVFVGWSTSENGEAVYDGKSVVTAPIGTVLYAVWKEAEWRTAYNSAQNIISIVVGVGEAPEDVLFDSEIFSKASSSKVSNYEGEKLIGWSYVKGGDIIFLAAEDNDWYKYVAPGTTLYAVYGDYQSYCNMADEYDERHGKVDDMSSLFGW